jgi:methionyl-tRNA formyltransferase
MINHIIFFGTDEELAVPPLSALIARHFDIKAIITKPDAPAGRGKKLSSPLVKQIGIKNHIPVFQPQKSAEITAILAQIRAENPKKPLVGVLAAYGKIIPQPALDLLEPFGIINLHPSLLPKYRGPSPIETAILNGDKKTGISLMKLTKEMDAGPLFAQKSLPLSGAETKKELYQKLSTLGTDLLLSLLPELPNLTPTPQKESQATYTQKLDKSLSELQPATHTAQQLHNQVRAFLGFPKSKLTLLGTPCTITAVAVAPHPETPLDPLCKDGKYLIIRRLRPANRPEMSPQDFLNGAKPQS